ncbi:MAG: hypothetical protein M1450_04685 [Patescibacteria group bacterium]|nr:hypothetical protein [Patescibacteria group bacterium]
MAGEVTLADIQGGLQAHVEPGKLVSPSGEILNHKKEATDSPGKLEWKDRVRQNLAAKKEGFSMYAQEEFKRMASKKPPSVSETEESEQQPLEGKQEEEKPFSFLQDAKPQDIARLIRDNPDKASIVLSHLLPEKIANTLSLFPQEKPRYSIGQSLSQSELLLGLATCKKVTPEELREVEASLKDQYSQEATPALEKPPELPRIEPEQADLIAKTLLKKGRIAELGGLHDLKSSLVNQIIPALEADPNLDLTEKEMQRKAAQMAEAQMTGIREKMEELSHVPGSLTSRLDQSAYYDKSLELQHGTEVARPEGPPKWLEEQARKTQEAKAREEAEKQRIKDELENASQDLNQPTAGTDQEESNIAATQVPSNQQGSNNILSQEEIDSLLGAFPPEEQKAGLKNKLETGLQSAGRGATRTIRQAKKPISQIRSAFKQSSPQDEPIIKNPQGTELSYEDPARSAQRHIDTIKFEPLTKDSPPPETLSKQEQDGIIGPKPTRRWNRSVEDDLIQRAPDWGLDRETPEEKSTYSALRTEASVVPEPVTKLTIAGPLPDQIRESLRLATTAETKFESGPEEVIDYLKTLKLPAGARINQVDGRIAGNRLEATGEIQSPVGKINFATHLENDPSGNGLRVAYHDVKLPLLARAFRGQIEGSIQNLNQIITSQINSTIDPAWEIANLRIGENNLVFDFKKK